MLKAVAAFAVRRRVAVLAAAPLLLAIAAFAGSGAADRLGSGGFHAARDESTLAGAFLDRNFDAGPVNFVLLVRAPSGVDQPATVQAGRALTARLAAERGIGPVVSYWSGGQPAALRSTDSRSALITARVLGNEDQVASRVRTLYPAYTGNHDGLTVQVGGQPAAERELVAASEHDLRISEIAAAPVVALVLLVVFGGVVAASLPLLVGLVAVLGTLATLTVLSAFTDVSIFSLNITTALGFGLAVDYGLFMVTRFREELDAGLPTPEAVRATVVSAGRTVLFSALTVATSLISLLVFPLYYLRSFAYAGIAVVGLAALGAVVVLPALLAVLGPRVDALPLRGLTRRLWAGRGAHRAPVDTRGGRVRTGVGFWHRLSTLVMRRPVPVGLAVVALLLVLGAPFAKASFALPDDRLAPVSSEAHQVAQALRDDYPQVATDAAYVVAPLAPRVADHWGEVEAYAIALSRVRGVERVDAMTGSYADGNVLQVATVPDPHFVSRDKNATWLSLVTRVEGYSSAGQQLARDVRAVPAGFDVYVGGNAAHLVDTKATLGHGLPYALLIVGLSTIVVLFMFTGSVLVPVKAVVLNLLSLTATFGAMVWGFQDGHLRPLVGDFQLTGTLELTTPILMFCIAFGLSMDYEVFLLSRIKEEYDRTGDNRAAVSLGLERTGRLITSAALIVVIVLLALATSSNTMLKLLGVGLALAVAVDATLIRGALVPAFMRIAGQANWWAPAPLRRLHSRIGFSESDAGPVPRVVRQNPGRTDGIGGEIRPTADTLQWRSQPARPVSDPDLVGSRAFQRVDVRPGFLDHSPHRDG
jgi:RND superfamily putative drug exporter